MLRLSDLEEAIAKIKKTLPKDCNPEILIGLYLEESYSVKYHSDVISEMGDRVRSVVIQ